MRSRLSLPAGVLCVVAVTLIAAALAGCGSGSSRSPQTILSDSSAASGGVKSCAIDFTTTITLDPASSEAQSPDGEAESALIAGHAVVGTDPTAMDLVITVDTPEDGEEGGAVRIVDGTTYVQEDDVWYRLPGTTAPGPDRTAQMQPMLNEAGLDTHDWLVDLEDRGIEEVDGQEAYHLSGSIDTARFASGVVTLLKDPDFRALLPKQQAQVLGAGGIDEADLLGIAAMVTDVRVDYWVSTEDSLPLRLDLSARINPSAVEAGEEQGAVVQAGVSIRESNEPVSVVAPAGARPWEDPALRARESAVIEGIHSIQVGLQSWAVDHDDQYPPVSVVDKAGLDTYVDNWPVNPYTGGPMTPGTGPGQYSYTTTGQGQSPSFKLVGHGADGKAVISVP